VVESTAAVGSLWQLVTAFQPGMHETTCNQAEQLALSPAYGWCFTISPRTKATPPVARPCLLRTHGASKPTHSTSSQPCPWAGMCYQVRDQAARLAVNPAYDQDMRRARRSNLSSRLSALPKGLSSGLCLQTKSYHEVVSHALALAQGTETT
jgi:hypothetical protein